MPFQFRRTKKLAPGVRGTISKTGVGVSVGRRGARVSAHSSGVKNLSVGIPGTGISYRKTKGRYKR